MFRKSVFVVVIILNVVVLVVNGADAARTGGGKTVIALGGRGGGGDRRGGHLPGQQQTHQVDGCLGFGTCCSGKNVSCVGLGPSQNNKSADRCFCDEDCLRLADCCLDYRFKCKSVNCRLSDEWSEWSKCDQTCGVGAQQRTRQVLVQPENGGKKCDGRVERRMCEGFNCKVKSASFPKDIAHDPNSKAAAAAADKVSETANIVPAIFASWRTNAKYNPLEDIRQSLFLHNIKYAALLKDRKPSYCAKFRVTETRGACNRPTTERGSAAAAGGRGGPDAAAAAGGQETVGRLQSRVLMVGRTVCVECQPFGILQRTTSAKCVGDGLFQVETPWNFVTTPGCHGKWVMASHHQVPCHCDASSDTSFVFV